MNDKRELLVRLAQTLLPLVFAGGATGILTVFKESLSATQYSVFINIIWAVTIIMLVYLVLNIIFGNVVSKSVRLFKNKKQQKANKKIAKELQNHFIDLRTLILDLIDNDWAETEDQTNRYYKIHLWFKANRTRFLSLWYSFNHSRVEPDNPIEHVYSSDLEHKVFYTNYRDPFSVFYESLRLTILTSVLKKWRKYEVQYVLEKLMELTIEFRTWISIK